MSILLIVVWAVIVPFIIGFLVFELGYGKVQASASDNANNAEKKTDIVSAIIKNILMGNAIMMAVFQIFAVPMISKMLPFHILKNLWLVIVILLCIFGLLYFFKTRQILLSSLKFEKGDYKMPVVIVMLAAVFLIMFQTWLLGCNVHIDTDDARFVAEAVAAVEKDSMITIHPITGEEISVRYGELRKDVTSPYPVYLGLLSYLFRLPPAVCAHTYLPFILIPFCYMSFYLVADYLFKGDKYKTWLFLLFLALIHLFSFESIFSSGYTLLTIIWQGRSIFAMVLLPLLWYILMRFFDEATKENEIKLLISFAMVMLASAMLSGMGIMLSLALGVAYAAAIIWNKKNLVLSIKLMILMIPNIIYLIMFKG